jgi:hypothetical protein
MTESMDVTEYNAARGKHKKRAPLGKAKGAKRVETPEMFICPACGKIDEVMAVHKPDGNWGHWEKGTCTRGEDAEYCSWHLECSQCGEWNDMRRVAVVDLPLPHRVLHPNGRTRKYGWRAKLVKEHRELACLLARSQAPKQPWGKAKYRVTFSLPRKQDEDNLGAWLKSYLDGIQDAGIVENDSGLTRDSLVILSGKKQTGGKIGLRFEIWEE